MPQQSLRQIMYVSRSNVGHDARLLDQIVARSQCNNALDGITGLLWTDGHRFAQVLEGTPGALAEVMDRICSDPRHRAIEIVHDALIAEREFGDWSMTRPAVNPLAERYERRLQQTLATLTGALAGVFDQIISGSRPAATA